RRPDAGCLYYRDAPPDPPRRARIAGARPAQDLRQRRGSAQGRFPGRRPWRLFRHARTQRRRPVDPDRHRHLAGEQDCRRRARVRRRHRPRTRCRDAPARPGAAGNQLQHVREPTRHPGQLRRVLRHPAARGAGARRAGAQGRPALGQGRQDGAHAVGRHEAQAHDRAGDDDPAAPADPRRAHRRRRHRDPPRHVEDAARDQRRRHHHHPHHPLPRGGGEPVPQPRDHRQGHHRRTGADALAAGQARRGRLPARRRRRAAGATAADRGRGTVGARRPHHRPGDAASARPDPRVRAARRRGDPGPLDAQQVQPPRGTVRAPDRRRSKAMNAGTAELATRSVASRNWIALGTIARREVARILRIWTQTLIPPAITMTLYFLIFGGLIGSRVGKMDGIGYMDFIVPGLVMMSVIQNSYGNISSSFFGAKFGRHVEELLVSPMPHWVILGGYVAGAVLRGLMVGAIVLLIAMLFTRVRIPHPLVTLSTVLLGATIFSLAGFVNAVFAKKFDDVAIVPVFILTPLTYLGGVFYSIRLLPGWAEAATHANPIFYMVNAFRYGLLGVSDVPLWIAYA